MRVFFLFIILMQNCLFVFSDECDDFNEFNEDYNFDISSYQSDPDSPDYEIKQFVSGYNYWNSGKAVPTDILGAFFPSLDATTSQLLYERINVLYKKYKSYTKGSYIADFEDDGRPQPSKFSHIYKTNSRQHIIFINGIKTTYEYFQKHLAYIKGIVPNANIYGVYNSTKNFETDILECHLGLCGIYTPPTKILKDSILSLYRTLNWGDKLTLLCHSQGAIHAYNALLQLPYEITGTINVIAVAPAKFIPSDLARNSINVISSDFVPKLQYMYGFSKKNVNLNELPLIEDKNEGIHSFQSLTYKEFLISNLGKL